MSRLPAALASWASLLSWLRPEFQLTLASHAQHMALAIGPLRGRREQGPGEPDGYDGLTRRGPYDRLLTTEWLLADEAPDEFLRRAVMREHAFLALANCEPRRVETCVVLLDGGPDQLGAPRIAQLAALICLSRRALEAGAEFRWGLLQDPQTRIFGAVDQATVTAFLAARAARDPNVEDLARWEWLLESEPAPDDLWWLGGSALAALTQGRLGNRVTLSEPIQAEPACVRGVVSQRRSGTSTFELERPPQEVEGQLLVSPFEPDLVAPRARPASPGPHLSVYRGMPLLFSPSGRRLFVATRERGLGPPMWVACSVKLREDGRAGRDRRVWPPAHGEGVGLGWANRSMLHLVLSGDELTLSGEFGRDPATEEAEVVAAGPLKFMQAFPRGHHLAIGETPGLIGRVCTPPTSFVLDLGGRLVVAGPKGVEVSTDERVVASLIRTHGSVFVTRRKQYPHFQIHRFGRDWEREFEPLPGLPSETRLCLGPPPVFDSQNLYSCQFAWQVPGSSTVGVRWLGQLAEIPDVEGTLVGVIAIGVRPWRPFAVLLSASGGLTLRNERRVITVPTDGEVLQVAVGTDSPTLAWLSATGELRVWSPQEDEWLLERSTSLVEARS